MVLSSVLTACEKHECGFEWCGHQHVVFLVHGHVAYLVGARLREGVRGGGNRKIGRERCRYSHESQELDSKTEGERWREGERDRLTEGERERDSEREREKVRERGRVGEIVRESASVRERGRGMHTFKHIPPADGQALRCKARLLFIGSRYCRFQLCARLVSFLSSLFFPRP